MLGDDLSESELDTFNDVLGGAMLGRLQDMKDEVNDYNQQLIDLRFKKGVDPQVIKNIEGNLLAMRQNMNGAIETHNKIANWIQTATGQNIGLAGYGGMGRLGMIPVVVYTVAAIAGGLIALAIALDALANFFNAAQGHGQAVKGYIEQVSDVIGSTAGLAKSTSGLLVTVAVVGAVGVVGYFVFKELRKRGRI